MGARAASAVIGIVFGAVLAWAGMTDPDVIREGLLFQDSYLFLFFAGAVGTAFAGTQLLKRHAPKALLTGERVEWDEVRPERRHVVGSVLFGIGWGAANVCPGPIAAQLGMGIGWSLATTAGLVAGIVVFGRMQARESASSRTSGVIPSPAAADASA